MPVSPTAPYNLKFLSVSKQWQAAVYHREAQQPANSQKISHATQDSIHWQVSFRELNIKVCF